MSDLRKEVRLTDVRSGDGARSHFIYAKVVDAETGEMLISATVDYILQVAQHYGYKFVK